MKIRKSFWIILAALFVAIGAPSAHADSFYTINFASSYGYSIPSSGTPPTSGIVDYTGTSITATIVWEGLTFNFTDADLTDYNGLIATGACSAGNQATIALEQLQGCTGYVWWYGNSEPGGGSILATGSQAITCVSTACDEDYFTIDAGGASDIETTEYAASGTSYPAAQGNLTISAPEPGTVGLLSLGIVLVLAMRKRVTCFP